MWTVAVTPSDRPVIATGTDSISVLRGASVVAAKLSGAGVTSVPDVVTSKIADCWLGATPAVTVTDTFVLTASDVATSTTNWSSGPATRFASTATASSFLNNVNVVS